MVQQNINQEREHKELRNRTETLQLIVERERLEKE
jgi:hypothetical protein